MKAVITEEEFDELKRRVAVLEKAKDPCKDGHAFQQAEGNFGVNLFCSRCGKLIVIEHKTSLIGFNQNDDSTD